jgi:hypothetical protein
VLAGVTQRVRNIMQITHVEQLFQLCDNVEAAQSTATSV